MSFCASAPSAPTSMVATANHSISVHGSSCGNSRVCVRTMRVEADLGQQPGEQRGDRRGSVGVAVGQPEVQRHHRRLDPEHHQQHQRQDRPQAGRQRQHPLGQVGEVHRRRRRVHHRHGGQEQQRRQQADGHVRHPGPDRLRGGAPGDQHVGRRQHDLERDEQREQVARQVGQRDPGGEHQVHRVERRARHPPAVVGDALGDRVHEHGQRDQRRDQQQQRRTAGRPPARSPPAAPSRPARPRPARCGRPPPAARPATAATAPSVVTAITRCAATEVPTTTVSAAPRIGSSTGRVGRTVIALPRATPFALASPFLVRVVVPVVVAGRRRRRSPATRPGAGCGRCGGPRRRPAPRRGRPA